MDFSLPHIHEESLATLSKIRHINIPTKEDEKVATTSEKEPSTDELLIEEANNAAAHLFLAKWNNNSKNTYNDNDGDDKMEDNKNKNSSLSAEERRMLMNSASYPERSTPQTERITEDSLVVIFESFDSLSFCYPKKGEIFSNRNGHFPHEDFIGKPFGCKLRSRNNQGWGYVYLLKPTPELWSRSLNHRTQIIHFLDASMIVFYLNIRPNMVVCESGTGSGALSHCIMRSVAPRGMLHTFEFNKQRAEEATKEFASNGVSHISKVYHKDVCGKHGPGGFDQPQASVDAIVLDLPEPWLAVAHAAYCIKRNARLVSYSPCIEQAQKTIEALKKSGFHTIKTMEFRLKENYVDEIEYEMPPTVKRQRIEDNRVYPKEDKEIAGGIAATAAAATATNDNESGKPEEKKGADIEMKSETSRITGGKEKLATQKAERIAEAATSSDTTKTEVVAGSKRKPKTKLVARPFVIMRGHTAFLTFATAGNKLQPKL
uniref:tRNA (adenine(58)-N(1))-methyltransferase n=1 Tax=Pseudo-nitzschia australis TaxID=44445 RepID=A0A7S4AAX0_9STRA|mmetsp:Transcript_1009/g.2332  ORF Transcript_1009/g.2332 Transcript_1009/m.2332 type:complete len:488 (+) Transcript_1009:67-1530(+)|eukprot:CAMPEP_0168181762 /NCGR_PEP_ID=MMETSP0139_2-20121125/11446_1 /TAXON_ID=44445 /ORGANISM="Pseudo-nitzschia australis, Strain 10249 10 AB" /LENGTH=487 /DNA_ID=CAMNT_0008102473 /DNA_START=51 /DNA_END=1514 /DNA_ORIENTATION=+